MPDPYMHMRGRLVATPTYQVTAGGLHRTRFRIATNGRRFDKDTNGYVDRDPVFMSVVCWRQLADNVAKSLRKGDAVMVYGRLTFSEYDDPNGNRRQSYEIEASSVGPDLARYVGTFGKPLRELPDGEPSVVPAQASDDPWGAPVPAAAEETAA